MISFSREENKVTIKIKHGLFYNGDYFSLPIQQSYEYQAELLRRQLENHLNDQLKRIKREAYNEGWKDKSAKRKKRDEFYGGW
jgi:hypothetical protein